MATATLDARPKKGQQPTADTPTTEAAGGDAEHAIDCVLDQMQKWEWFGKVRKAEAVVKRLVMSTDIAATKRVRVIQRDAAFKRLEGTCLALGRLVKRSSLGANVQLRVMHLSKDEAAEDLDHPAGIEHSQLHRLTIDNGIGVFGGTPTAAILADYEFGPGAEDLSLLRNLARVSEKGKAPLLTNASPPLANLRTWGELAGPRSYRSLARIADLDEFADFRAFREEECARYVALTLPRVLARRPYGSGKTCAAVKGFDFEECELNDLGQPLPLETEQYTWCGAAWALAERVLDAAAKYGICVALFGPEAGGAVRDLPSHVPVNEETGEAEPLCPSEVSVTFKKEGILSELGFIPLVHKKKTTLAAFLSSQTARLPRDDIDPDKAADEELAATLVYQFARCRLLHHLIKFSEQLLGKALTLSAIEERMNLWLTQFVLDGQPSETLCNEYPFASATVRVIADRKKPGVYRLVLLASPWVRLKAVSVEVKLTATVKTPTAAGG
jgi:type VI secretion system protein ImpC